jgi:predicted amidohydrolase YtcJ
MNTRAVLLALTFSLAVSRFAFAADDADLILHNGRVVTVDKAFSIAEAVAVKDGKITAVGTSADILTHKGDKTEVVDLGGKMLLPGLMDSHTHSIDASLHEFDHETPAMESIDDVLAYIKQRAEALGPGKWIELRQVFVTRLKEQRFPTRAELDAAAPENPVLFVTGHDASVNSLALKASQIDREFRPADPASKIERDPKTGEPTGILRGAEKYVKIKRESKQASPEQRDERLRMLFADYNSVGITGVIDRSVSDLALAQYQRMSDSGVSTVRVAASMLISNTDPLDTLEKRLAEIARNPLRFGSPRLRVIGVKAFLDGGMLTGSAYMRKPWGVSSIYSIDDPRYQGLLFIPPERLVPMVRATVEKGLQFTAHSVGDGAIHTLLDAYEEVNRSTPIAATRPCLTHSNFMSQEAVEQAARLCVVMDIQPAWLWLDGKTLLAQFGDERLAYFQPLKSIFEAGAIAGGGSDHMQKIGRLRSLNPYDPFLGMWVAMKRVPRGMDTSLHREQALTREQAIRFYTINNAYMMFLEDKVGSLEPGKLADMIVVDRDLLTCPLDDVRDANVLRTYLEGKLVYHDAQ